MNKSDLQKVWSALALYISMVRSGEIESPSSVAEKDEAFTILNRLLAESELVSVLDSVGYVDGCGNFEPYMQPWMAEEPNVEWRPVYLHSPLTKPASGEMPTPDSFVEYMSKNYPPLTVISDPNWHAQKIWHAAMHALQERSK